MCFNKKDRYVVNDKNIVLNKNTYKSPALHTHLFVTLSAPVGVDFISLQPIKLYSE